MQTGVYRFRNRDNGKVYVGSAARSIRTRRYEHVRMLNNSTHVNKYLQNAWNKHGAAAFTFRVLERCPPEQCLAREQHWIDKLRAADPRRGYNRCPKAGSVLGCRWKRDPDSYKWMENPEWREKIRQSSWGRKHTEETKAKIGAGNRGKLAGRKLTEDHKAKISWLGRKHSVKTKAKISAALKGKVVSDETRRRMSLAAKRRCGVV